MDDVQVPLHEFIFEVMANVRLATENLSNEFGVQIYMAEWVEFEVALTPDCFLADHRHIGEHKVRFYVPTTPSVPE